MTATVATVSTTAPAATVGSVFPRMPSHMRQKAMA